MQVAERVQTGRVHEAARALAMQATTRAQLQVVLKPLARTELGEIRIDDSVFAIGRTEQPFATYGPDVLVMLSRRHARIFRENGAVYLADLGSRNGTTVNRSAVQNAPRELRDGDEIGFGGVLSYRVQITSRAATPPPAALTLTLTPAAADAGLEPIVIARFPFLVSKTDAAFARYRASHPKQLDFLSRRQAHLFVKGGDACIEDLGSTNGTFVNGERLAEHAVPLADGALLAFGGDHFVYRVGVRRADPELFDAATRLNTPNDGTAAAAPALNAGKTTFVAAPDSFLDIFCVSPEAAKADPAPAAASAPGRAEPAAGSAAKGATKSSKRRGRLVAFVSELASVLAGGRRDRLRRGVLIGAAVLALLTGAFVALSLWRPLDRELKDLIEAGDFAQASRRADEALRGEPDDAELRSLATEAALKTHVPQWLAKLAARDFDGARTVIATIHELAARNGELKPLVAELEWLGSLEQLIHARGGPDAPVRIFGDEDRIAAMLERWNAATGEHQRALARVASLVPQFAVPYAEALTHLRKLQSDATVHLAAIERLKAILAAELERDRPEAIELALKDYTQRYPNLGGLDSVQQDLRGYLALRDARARKDRLLALMAKARFVTPPFQQAVRAWTASAQLPPSALMRQYESSTRAWQAGQAEPALAELQRLVSGPWADAVAKELERRQTVVARFAALRSARPADIEQLLAFRETLDPEEDVFYLRAIEQDLALHKDKIDARAQQLLAKARVAWQEYRSTGGIEASQRIEITISPAFRTRARLLAEAGRAAAQGLKLAALAGVAPAADGGSAIGQEIRAEAQLQRNALLDLRNVLEPELLKSKLALLGDPPE